MSLTTLATSRESAPERLGKGIADVLVACPDARPPAYEAVVGFAESGRLQRFLTAFYHRGEGAWTKVLDAVSPVAAAALKSRLGRRRDSRIPASRVRSYPSYDLALQLENRIPSARGAIARFRTDQFDRFVARELKHSRPKIFFVFSDVASEYALPFCRREGIASVLSMVHGEVHEEKAVLEAERERSPEFFPIYLGDGRLDLAELNRLHERRLRDVALADRVLVPSEHIADRLEANGASRDKISVIPYAADVRRFRPAANKSYNDTCRFLFAGGITQRKGIKYLLEAWRRIKRPGWSLRLAGALPSAIGPLEKYLGEVDHLGRASHSEMPAVMADSDVFVFPSLFEGSAVVTYEAMACGLPCVVTPNAGSVARDGLDGFTVPAANVEALAERMERLGTDPELRERMSISARRRAEEFDWSRYREALADRLAEFDEH